MATNAEKRLTMIVTAMAEVSNGSHYLTGGDGAIPGKDGTGLIRNIELLEDLAIENLGVHAAKNGFGVCRGRWSNVKGRKFIKGKSDRDTDLPKYLEELKASWVPPYFWWDFQNTGLYPRLSSGYIYLGEDCRAKKHFDCEGFVAWVLVKALGKDKGTWRKGVGWYQNGGDGRLEIYQYAGGGIYKNADADTISQSEILDGDILIRKPNSDGGEHIALARAKGSGVLEASGKNRGVIASGYEPNWTQLARLKTL